MKHFSNNNSSLLKSYVELIVSLAQMWTILFALCTQYSQVRLKKLFEIFGFSFAIKAILKPFINKKIYERCSVERDGENQ